MSAQPGLFQFTIRGAQCQTEKQLHRIIGKQGDKPLKTCYNISAFAETCK
jgi:hypothetical protein